MPNRVRIDPIKVNVINYQSVRRGHRVELRESHGSQSSQHGQQRGDGRQRGECRPRERPVHVGRAAEQANGNAAEGAQAQARHVEQTDDAFALVERAAFNCTRLYALALKDNSKLPRQTGSRCC
jgi:hypothetical protein